jgi:hypothetical protein
MVQKNFVALQKKSKKILKNIKFDHERDFDMKTISDGLDRPLNFET